MRLAVMVDCFPCWSERFVAREVAELVRQGVETTVFALRSSPLPADDDEESADLPARRQLLPRATAPGTSWGALMLLCGRPVGAARLAEVVGGLGAAGVLRAARWRALARLLKDGGYTHVHAHFANLPSTIAWLAARAAGLPFSFSAHARDLFVEAQCLEAKARDATACLACHAAGHAALRAVAGAEKARLIHHGLPLALFPFRPHAPGCHGDCLPMLLAAGRLVPKKGFGVLLEALATPALRDYSLGLTIHGEGPLRSDLTLAAARLRLPPCVALAPPLGGQRLRLTMAAAAALVTPSLRDGDGDSDGIPNLVLEAFASGVPVVGTDAGGLPEVLTPETGWVARAGDVASLAATIAECLENPAESLRRARAARNLVEERFEISRNVRALREAIFR
jgi:glycosyltransferase involved in cell wall biosynthesis